MLKIQQAYIDYISNVASEVVKIKLADTTIKSFRLEESIKAIKETELLIPVIGAFSAGKSSLLNSFLGEYILPEGIAPETAMATELRYSKQERIEAVHADGNSETFSIDDIEKVKDRASEFKLLRMHLKNDQLLNIEPLILVDMPGFESPLDLHNQAIMEYINRGVHYIVLTSVEDGNITKSMVRQLENIQDFKRDFSFFLSKTNLKSKEDVEAIRKKVQEQLEYHFDKTDDVGLVDDHGGESLKCIVDQINPDQLFKSLFLEMLKDHFFDIQEAINTNISSLSHSKEQNETAIQQLKKALADITRKKEELIENARDKYSNSNISRIVEAVGMDLSNAVDEIVTAGMSGGSSAISNVISDIAKNSLIHHTQSSISDIGSDIVDDFSLALKGLNSTMSGFSLSEDWLEKIADTSKNLLNSTSNALNTLVKNRQEKTKVNTDVLYKTITTVLAVTTTVLNPVLELVIIFLPQILDGIMGSMRERKQREQLQSTILTNVIPALKRELRSKLPDILDGQINQIIQSIGDQFESVIQEKQDSIAASQQEMDEKNVDIEQAIQEYRSAHENIQVLAHTTLYGGK